MTPCAWCVGTGRVEREVFEADGWDACPACEGGSMQDAAQQRVDSELAAANLALGCPTFDGKTRWQGLGSNAVVTVHPSTIDGFSWVSVRSQGVEHFTGNKPVRNDGVGLFVAASASPRSRRAGLMPCSQEVAK